MHRTQPGGLGPASGLAPDVKGDPPPLLPASFAWLAARRDWRQTWTHIVAGNFFDSGYSGLLFYEGATGHAEFYRTDGHGGVAWVSSHDGWRASWTHIVPGAFYRPGRTGLLFYDQGGGVAEVCDVTDDGLLADVREHQGWRPSWTHISPIRVPDSPDCPNSDYTGIVLYDQAAGRGEIHRCKGNGELELIVGEDGWRTSWTHLVGDAASGARLLFYEQPTSFGETYAVAFADGAFQFEPTASYEGLPAATEIVAGNFGSDDTSFLFYDRPAGRGTFVMLNRFGTVPPVAEFPETYDDWGTSWDMIVPGQFWEPDEEYLKFQDGFTDLLFYDRAAGLGEFYLHEPYGAIFEANLEGFASPGSIAPGETISLHVNSRVGPYTIAIVRQGADEVALTTLQSTQQQPQPFPIGRLDYRDGPAWPASAQLTVPPTWPSGLYLARAETEPGATTPASYDMPFVVRSARPGSQASILLCVPDATYAAYNFWGGRGLYGFRSLQAPIWSYGPSLDPLPKHQLPRAFRVAYERPYLAEDGLPANWQRWEVPMIRWLANEGIPVDLCTATDLHKDEANHTHLLRSYRLLISVGHDEYWSKEMRDNVEGFASRGGNVAFFSGNVSWFQVRLDLDGKRQVCYKDPDFDPYSGTEPQLTTTNWFNKPVCRPETSLTGVSWYGPMNQAQDYVVIEPDHWAFENTGLGRGGTFGSYGDRLTVVSYETDRYQCPQANPCQPSSPADFQRLAEAPGVDDGGDVVPDTWAATLGIFQHNQGQVFTAGAVNWSLGLGQDERIDQITRNVLLHLG